MAVEKFESLPGRKRLIQNSNPYILVYRPNQYDLVTLDVTNLQLKAHIHGALRMKNAGVDSQLEPVSVACTNNLSFLCCSSVDKSSNCYLTVFYSSNQEAFVYSISQHQQLAYEAKPGNMVSFKQIMENIDSKHLQLTHIESLEISFS